VPRRAAAHGVEPPQVGPHWTQALEVGQHHHPAVQVNAPTNGVSDRARLLVNLLEHIVLIAALGGQHRAPRYGGGHLGYRRAVKAHYLGALARHHRYLAILQEHHPLGVVQNGGHVRSDERLSFAQANDHGASIPQARCHEALRLPGAHHHHSTRPLQVGQGASHGGSELHLTAPVVSRDKVGDHLGVGLRGKGHPFVHKPPFELAIVLHDAVVNDDNGAIAIGVRVCVMFGDAAVGCPTGVPHARMPMKGRSLQELEQVLQLADAAATLDALLRQNGDARRVIAAVLEPFQALNDDAGRIARAEVSHNATHGGSPPRLRPTRGP